jgi:hypothetical protein
MTSKTSGSVAVLYIMGFGRSGSTLLDNVLGSIPGFFSAGELHMLWRALMQGSGCGCRRPVAVCPVWTAVLDEIRSAGWHVDPQEIATWQHREARTVHTPRLLRAAGPSAGRPLLSPYVRLRSDLYRSISKVTGARVIVDSSKTPADAATLPMLSSGDAYAIHLVRDPRAVAHSQLRRRPTLDIHRAGEMHRRGTFRSAARWVASNLLSEQVHGLLGSNRSLMVRYEDFVQRPVESTKRVLTLLGEAPDRLPFVDDTTVSLEENHNVWGNRSRFITGRVPLELDEEWRREGALRRALVTAVVFPWLGRYGYPIRAAGSHRGKILRDARA